MDRQEILETSDIISYRLLTPCTGLRKGKKYLAFNTTNDGWFTYGTYKDENDTTLINKVLVEDILSSPVHTDIIFHHKGGQHDKSN